MANSTDSEEFVLLSRVRTGHKREFAFTMKAQTEICGSLGRTQSRKTWNEAVARNRERGRVRGISGQYNRRTLTTKILASLNRQCTVTELFLPE